MDQRKVEVEEGSLLKEPTDQHRKEEEEEEKGSLLKDQRKEEEEGSVLKEPTDQREEEEASCEEPAGRRTEQPTDESKEAEAEAERSSDEESVTASTLFVHPCSLLRYLFRAFACCLGMPEDSFGGATKRSAAADPASVDSSREVETDRSAGATGFYMQEVITRVWAVRRPRPSGPRNPREGSGGNGGHHH